MISQKSSFAEFEVRAAAARQAGKQFAPVYKMIAGDTITPVIAYKAFATNPSFPSALLESVLPSKDSGRYSIIAINPFLCFESIDGKGCATFTVRVTEESDDPLGQLDALLKRYSPYTTENDPDFAGGAIGYFGHEAICLLEPSVPRAKIDDVSLPDICLHFYRDVIVFDRDFGKMFLLSNVDVDSRDLNEAFNAGMGACESMEKQMFAQNLDLEPGFSIETENFTATHTQQEFMGMVAAAKEHLRVGDVFQVVLSQRFQADFRGSTLDFYRALRIANPSPYMFHINLGFNHQTALVGASPEVMSRIDKQGNMLIRPLAGTIQRGNIHQETANAKKLRRSLKDRAEHRMLVDLARNDLSRFCSFDSVCEQGVMRVEPYGNLFHMVSDVTGRLAEGVSPFKAALGCLPAGTLSGAPKIRAMQIIAEREGRCRGPYGGSLGLFTDKAVDSCIVIRSAIINSGEGYIRWQTGAGIVQDSKPKLEFEETLAKGRLINKILREYQHA